MVEKKKLKKNRERRYDEEKMETLQYHLDENQWNLTIEDCYTCNKKEKEKNIISLTSINSFLWFTLINFIYRFLYEIHSLLGF